MSSPREPRFNLFAFAPEPSGRFLLFFAALFMLAVNLGLFLRFAFTPEADLASPFLDVSSPVQNLSGEAVFQTFHQEFWKVSNGTLQSLGFPLAFSLALVAIGGIAFFFHGRQVRRNGKSVRLTWQKDPSFFEAVEKLAERSGAAPPELWEAGTDPRNQGAQAFSQGKRAALRMDTGLRVLFRKKPEVFEALVLHELSHLSNRCLSIAYMVEAVWKAVRSWIAYPLGIAFAAVLTQHIETRGGASPAFADTAHFFREVLPTVLLFMLQAAGAAAVLAVLRGGFFRARALWADARAAAAGAGQGLEGLLSQKLPWQRERQEALKEPLALFRIAYDLPFWAGFLCAFVAGAVSLLLMPVTLGVSTALLNFGAGLADLAKSNPDDGMAILMILTVSLLFLTQILLAVLLVVMPLLGTGYLIARTVGRQIQRQAVVEMASGFSPKEGYGRLWPFAVLVAIGLEAGFFFTPYALYFPRSLKAAVFMIPWFGAMTELTWLCLAALRFFTRCLIGRHVGETAPHRKSAFITASVSGLIGAVYMPMFAARTLILARIERLQPVEILFILCSAVVVSLGIFSLISLIVSGLIPLRFSWKPPLCPACQQAVRQKSPLGKTCGHCGSELSGWILLRESQPAEAVASETLGRGSPASL